MHKIITITRPIRTVCFFVCECTKHFSTSVPRYVIFFRTGCGATPQTTAKRALATAPATTAFTASHDQYHVTVLRIEAIRREIETTTTTTIVATAAAIVTVEHWRSPIPVDTCRRDRCALVHHFQCTLSQGSRPRVLHVQCDAHSIPREPKDSCRSSPTESNRWHASGTSICNAIRKHGKQCRVVRTTHRSSNAQSRRRRERWRFHRRR